MSKITKFMIATDEAGDEYTSLIALVLEEDIELSQFICEGDAEESVINRIGDTLGARFKGCPSDQKYVGIINLYRTGEARVSLDGSASSTFEERGRKLALQAAEDLYDEVWPEIAKLSQQFVHGAVQLINSRNSVYSNLRVRQAVAIGAIESRMEPSTMSDLLRKLLVEEEKEFLSSGAITHKIAFLTKYGAPMMAVDAPYERYRFGRAMAEVARRVDAHKVIRISSGFLGDPRTGSRNGQEFLWGVVIAPDGSLEASAHGSYIRDNGRLRVVREIATTDDPTLEKQYLIPGWKLTRAANRKVEV
jgi:hypothetical protein